MAGTIYTATGCIRCKIAKAFMAEKGLDFAEVDIKGEDKAVFNRFYRDNRSDIFRGPEGIEFPIYHDGDTLKQGVGVIIGWLQAGDKLEGYISRSELSHGWIDGLNISSGDPAKAEDFLTVLRHLKKQGLMIQIETDGRNPDLLESIVTEKLADKVIFHFPGLAGVEETTASLALAALAPKYQLLLTIAPITRADGQISYLSPEEAAQAAALAEAVLGSKKHPFLIQAAPESELQGLEPLPGPGLFKYRTACRRFMVLAEIKKD